MNKDMGIVRENLEMNLRKELNAMDFKYQQKAFASLGNVNKFVNKFVIFMRSRPY